VGTSRLMKLIEPACPESSPLEMRGEVSR